MRSRWALITRGIAGMIAAGCGLARDGALAQTPLPGVVVTTPSPIVTPKPQPPSQKPAPQPIAKSSGKATAPAVPGQAEPLQAAGQPAGPSPAPGLPGLQVIVDDAFVAIAVKQAAEIAAQGSSSLGDQIAAMPGLAASTFAPGASRPIIRGLDNNRVRVQENGIGAHDVSALSEDHAVPIDPGINKQIEVIRGPATLRYGSQAIGGVVSAVNNRIPEVVPPKGISIETRGGWSSVDSGRDGVFIADVGSGPLALHADIWARKAGDYDTPQGRQLNSSQEASGSAFGGALIGQHGFVGIAWQSHQSLYHIPGIEAAERNLRIDLEQ